MGRVQEFLPDVGIGESTDHVLTKEQSAKDLSFNRAPGPFCMARKYRLFICRFILIMLLAFGVRTGISHHSFSGVYDASRVVTLMGQVTQFKWLNPHVLMYMDVADPSGKVTNWVVEFAGVLNLKEVGWTRDSVKPKERVTVTGNPTHAAGLARLAFLKLVKGDGTELLPGEAQRLQGIEEERRQRAAARERK